MEALDFADALASGSMSSLVNLVKARLGRCPRPVGKSIY